MFKNNNSPLFALSLTEGALRRPMTIQSHHLVGHKAFEWTKPTLGENKDNLQWTDMNWDELGQKDTMTERHNYRNT